LDNGKKIASGEDANKNRVLDDAEVIKTPEPGAQDNLHFNSDGKCRVFGMGMETAGTYRVKTLNGKKMILENGIYFVNQAHCSMFRPLPRN